ncbi:MAG: YihA family ribosome biogenesis GTP-binding protein [Firmicutes bacterium]|nr:YihA family ribosome biogenesis GTP-binding protein [Bacillota bacterium]MBQ6685734.1 YihA family ribosome biogenesis GTP-binding protein [Bacillota bacterium]
MLVKKAELKAVAVKKNQYPEDTLPEVAFAGRSNVGKSSLLNTLTNRKNLARVSGTPGKTRTINFFQINDAFRIVDLPGYGYAKLSKSATADWGNMMETYLANRENLRLVIQLVDIRHEPTAQDVQMYQWLQHYGLDGVVVATKADKISRNQLRTQMNLIRKTLGMAQDDIVLPVSSLKKTGYEDLWSVIEQIISDEEDEETVEMQAEKTPQE